MKKLLVSCAIAALGLGLSGSAIAQTPQTSNPGTMSTPAQAAPERAAPSVKAGETVYDTSGSQIGKIESVKTDPGGSSMAVVSVGKFLGLGSKDVLMPTDTLSVRAHGGYTTRLSSAEIGKLPEAAADTSSSKAPH